MRCRRVLVACLTIAAACRADDGTDDPLDRELLAKLAVAQGSASGDARSGTYSLSFETEACDCPSVEVDGQAVDLCALASFGELSATVVEGSGVLGISTDIPLLSGAIEADGSFVIAGTQDISALASPLEALRRMDGHFSGANDRAEGWAGQRLAGELATEPLDCRWTGSFVATRN